MCSANQLTGFYMTTLAFNELRRTNRCPKTAQNTIENLFKILNTYSNSLFELRLVLKGLSKLYKSLLSRNCLEWCYLAPYYKIANDYMGQSIQEWSK